MEENLEVAFPDKKKKERKKYFTVMHFGYINVTLNVLIQKPTGLSDYLLMVLL